MEIPIRSGHMRFPGGMWFTDLSFRVNNQYSERPTGTLRNDSNPPTSVETQIVPLKCQCA